MRAGIKRCFDSGDAPSESEAITILWDKHLLPHKNEAEGADPRVYNQ